MKGNPDVIKVLNEVLRKGAHRHQSILHPCKNVQKLGLQCARRARMERVHRRNETRGSNRGKDSFPRRRAERSSLRQDSGRI